MKAILDGLDLALDFSGQSLSSALDAVRLAATRRGYAITGLVLDENDLTGEVEAKIGETDVDEFEVLHVHCRAAGELASATLEELARHVEPLENMARKALGLLETGRNEDPEADRNEDPFELLPGVLELTGTFLQTIHRIVILLNLEADSPGLEGIGYAELAESGMELLCSGVEAHRNGDTVELSDLLRYELLPALPGWREFLDRFRRHIDNMQ